MIKREGRLRLGDFPTSGVLIRFPDDSEARFRYAFALPDADRGWVAVFTEHCGYFEFRLQPEMQVLELDVRLLYSS